jgi:hypothetical protein
MSLLISLLLPRVHKDDKVVEWITVNGQHIPLGADGSPVGGNPAVLGGNSSRDYSKLATSQESSMRLKTTEREALQHYASNHPSDGYQQINQGLRKGDGNCSSCGKLDSAISKSEVTKDVQVFRGASLPESVLASLKSGAEFTDKGYVSTSLDHNTASKFAAGSAVFSIHVPKGLKGIFASHYTENDEKELLLPRGSKFRVDSVTHSGGRTYINATHLGT